MNIILDIGLIWFDKCDEEVMLQYLDSVTEFIDKYLSVNYLSTSDFIILLYKMMKDPMGEYRESSEFKNSIVSKIFRSLDNNSVKNATTEELLNVTDYLTMFKLPPRVDLQNYVKNVFAIMNRGQDDIIFFLSPNNFKWISPLPSSAHVIKDIFREIDSYLSILLSEGQYVKTGSLLQPSLLNPLPNVNLCKEYSELRKHFITIGNGTISTYLAISSEVALRNGYIFNKILTRINNNAIRQIFSSKGKHVYHLSIDVEHGALELCNEEGHHQGEYSYEGKKIGPPKANHDIKVRK